MNIYEWSRLQRVFYEIKELHFDLMVKKNSIEELFTELLNRGALSTGTRECYLFFEDGMFVIIPKCTILFDGDTVVDIKNPWLIGICYCQEGENNE